LDEGIMADLRHQIAIEATPQQVYAALTTQAGLTSWWTIDSHVEQTVGRKAEFGFNRRGAVYRMTITTLEPGKRVVWSCQGDNAEWAGTTLTWSIAPQGSGSVLRFTHGGWKRASDFFAMCNSTWGELMYRLQGYLEGRAPGPRWTE
jgi:uncharacterized protein YndB with AHSA1/START domain